MNRRAVGLVFFKFNVEQLKYFLKLSIFSSFKCGYYFSLRVIPDVCLSVSPWSYRRKKYKIIFVYWMPNDMYSFNNEKYLMILHSIILRKNLISCFKTCLTLQFPCLFVLSLTQKSVEKWFTVEISFPHICYHFILMVVILNQWCTHCKNLRYRYSINWYQPCCIHFID